MEAQLKLILAVVTTILYRFKEYRSMHIAFVSVANSMYWEIQAEVLSPSMRKNDPFLPLCGTGDTPLEALKTFAEKADSWLERADVEIERKRLKRAIEINERIDQMKNKS